MAMRRRTIARRLSAVCALLLTLTATSAHADELQPDGKGIVGGSLLGAEIAIFGEAIAGLERPWLYWLGAGLGAGAGGYGGYVLDEQKDARLSTMALALGMALSIPAFVVYLDGTSASRLALPSDYEGPNWEREPPPLSFAAPPPLSHGAIELAPNTLSLAFPDIAIEPVFTPKDRAQFGLPFRQRFVLQLLWGSF